MKEDDIILSLKGLMNNKCISMVGDDNSICKKKGGCDGHCPYFINTLNDLSHFITKNFVEY